MSKLLERNAERLAALGHPVRLAILRAVVKGPETGTPAGDLQSQVGIPASTLSHHLATLSEADLVKVERSGNFLLYRCDFKSLQALCDFIWMDCCGKGKSCC
ncbi:MAG: helix-turn-helix transcriptional regulator [Acidobacteriota bacterium]|nr:helix-turn-helix transcriptional regulator [Acidobacteriota bacterium]